MTTLFTSFVLTHPLVSALVVFVLLTAPIWLGVVVIGERQVGVVVKKFSSRALPVGRLIALDGEAGYQAETLPPGVHFGYWRWQYSVAKAPLTVIPQGEIGLVVAADGKAMARRADPGALRPLQRVPGRARVPHRGRREGPPARDPDRGHLSHQPRALRRHHPAGGGGARDDARTRCACIASRPTASAS